jgi:glycosyltransferase involved in cell wall biosynthesis
MSATELAASGVPLIVSDLPGLREAVVPGVTGDWSSPGNSFDLAEKIRRLVDEPKRRAEYGQAARSRAVTEFSTERQTAEISSILWSS